MTWKVPRIWEEGECWIIGGGPSLSDVFAIPEEVRQKVYIGAAEPSIFSEYLEPIRERHIIGVNNAYRLGAWVDVVFFGDSGWHLKHRSALAKWPGIKVTCHAKFANRSPQVMEGIKYVERDTEHPQGLTSNPRKVSWNGSSGAAAINLAVHFGVRRIYLLGFDMAMDEKGENSHWFGSHLPPGQKAKRLPPFARHLKGFPAIAKDAEQLGIEILNVNPNSKIEVFPKITLQEALGETTG